VYVAPWAIAAVAPAALAALAVAALRAAERARERRRHATLGASLGDPLSADARASIAPGAVGTLEGIIVPTSPIVVSFHPYGTSFLDERNVYAVTHVPAEQALELELDGGGRGVVEGAVQVLVGSTETDHGVPLERAEAMGAEELATSKVKKRVGQFRVIRPGDRVRVRGALSPAPDDNASYREHGKTLRIAPEKPEEGGFPGAVLLVASRTSTRRLGDSRYLRLAVAGAVFLGGSAAGLFRAMERRTDRPVTVATPGPPACRQTTLDLFEKNHPGAATTARTCGDPYAQALGAFFEGSFQAASRAFVEARATDPALAPTLTEAEAHLFVHDFAHAASTVRVMVSRFYTGPETAEKRYLECIASVLETRAGQADGGPPPTAHDSWMNTDYRKICSQRPLAQFARELDAEGRYLGFEDMKAWQKREYASAGAYDVVATPFTSPLAPRARLTARPIALEKNIVDRLVLTPPPPGFRPSGEFGRMEAFVMVGVAWEYARVMGFVADVALFHAYSGLPERNAAYWPILDDVAERLETDRPFYKVQYGNQPFEKKQIEDETTFLSYVMSLGASAALLSGDAARTERYAKLGEVHSARIIGQLAGALKPGAAWETPPEDGHWPDHERVFDAGLTGDGLKVAEALVATRSTGRDTLPRVLPLVRTNRRELDTWFASSFPAPCLGCGASTLHGHLVDRRAVGRLLGGAAAAEGERYSPTVLRFTDALTDPAIPFELDELETFFAVRR